MSTNIQVTRQCQFCGNDFTAKTTVTKWCSHNCARRAAKQRIRDAKISKSNSETIYQAVETKRARIDKDVFTVKQCADILETDSKSIYKLIKAGNLHASNLAERMIRIRALEINRLLDNHIQSDSVVFSKKGPETNTSEKTLTISNSYSIKDLCAMFSMNRDSLYTFLKRKGIRKVHVGREVYYSKKECDHLYKIKDQTKLLGLDKERIANGKIKTPLKVEDCYMIHELEVMFNSSRNNLYGFFDRRCVPKIKVGVNVYLSKKVIDKIYRAWKRDQG